MKKARAYPHPEGHLSTVKTGNPWHTKARGAVRWGERDYVLWRNGEVVRIEGCLTPGGISFDEAQAFVESGILPKRK